MHFRGMNLQQVYTRNYVVLIVSYINETSHYLQVCMCHDTDRDVHNETKQIKLATH